MPQLVQTILDENKATEAKWRQYFIEKDAELETEYSLLMFGVKTRLGAGWRKVGYQRLRDFTDGDQWLYRPEGGASMPVYNYCRSTALNYTAFMTNEPLDIDVPAIDITDKVEVARGEAKEKALKEVLEENNFNTLFENAIFNGSLLGDSVILGPFYNKKKDEIEIRHAKMPEQVKIIWKDDEYTEIFGYIQNRYMSAEKLYEEYGEDLENKNVSLSTGDGNYDRTSAYAKSQRHFIKVLDCYTADTHMVILADSVVLKYEVNNHGFVPIIHVPNIIHQEEPWGISDIEDLLDAQVEYNEKNSDMSEVIAQNAYDYIFGKNLNPSEVQSGRVNLIDVGDEAELIADPRRGRSGDLTNDISKRLSDIFKISGLNENIFGGVGVRAITGRALSVLMQTVNNRIKGRQTRWTEKLQEMFKNIFVLMEKYTDGGKELVGEYYKVDIFFPGTLVRNITDEINKFNAKVQSQETTMKNMGVPSPKDEKKLIKRELEDKMLMIEISRNPAMQLQVQQMLQQMVAEEVAGDKPTLREDENQEGDEPASAAGAPQQGSQSLAGAVAQAAQRGGGSVPAGPKEGES